MPHIDRVYQRIDLQTSREGEGVRPRSTVSLPPQPLSRSEHDPRKQAVFHAVLEYAVELEELNSNPLRKVKWKPPKTTETVDPRVAVNPRQAQES